MQLAKVAKLKADEIVASESSDEEGWLVETSSTFAHSVDFSQALANQFCQQ